MDFTAIIVAAGSGQRAGPGGPKQWRGLLGKPVLRWSVEAFIAAGAARIVVVGPSDGLDTTRDLLAGLDEVHIVAGGTTRHQSVQNGLRAAAAPSDSIVMIHDAARPLLETRHVEALLAALNAGADGALPGLPVADTLKRRSGAALSTVDRENLWRAQTPQAFRAGLLAAAYAAWPADQTPTDDAQVVERHGGRVAIIPGDARLMKLTYPEDFDMAEQMAGGPRAVRMGQGFDAHRWGPGETVWLCGVAISHDQTLIGHSDADAGLHALTDALLGAIGEGDIGDHFPPSDPQWRGAPSALFLEHAAKLVAERGGRIVNVDVTLICERPKIKPHRQAMRETLAKLLGLPVERVSVKATTTEGMGFTGRGEGLAAQAIAAVDMPL